MLFGTILNALIGAMYLWMGALVRFGGRAELIANFVADEKAGRFDRAYAGRVGVIWLVSGAVCLAAAAAGLLCRPSWPVALGLCVGVLGSLVAYRLNYRASIREAKPAAEDAA